MITSLFVYGTLKRGQCRESMWPCAAQFVVPGWVSGELYSRIDYPALRLGTDRIAGELWQFSQTQMADVLSVLDEIEGTSGNRPDDLYHRMPVEVFDGRDTVLGNAFTYFYVRDPLADGFTRIGANDNGYVVWPAP